MNRHRAVNRRRRGQILIVTLLALILLASMVFFVFNSGEQVNRRITTQTAADSAALGGATWWARSMNLVAMNNVAQSRLITLSAELDSLPLATELTYNELSTIIEGLKAQLNDPRLTDPTLRSGIEWMLYGGRQGDFEHPGLERQKEKLEPIYQSLVESGYDVKPITFWNGGNGRLWVGAKALEDLNRATIEMSGVLAQATASRMAAQCLAGSPSGSAGDNGGEFLVPVLPEMPAKLGEFRDFDKPIMKGIPPERVAGTTSDQFQRGPYDVLFLWHTPLYDAADSRVIVTPGTPTYVPPRRSNPIGSNGQPGLSPNPPGGQGGYWTNNNRVVTYPGPQIGWNPYGVYDWSLTVGGYTYPNSGLVNYCNDHVPDLPSNLFPGGSQEAATSNFLKRMQFLTKAKLDYMFGRAASGSKKIHRPEWIASYPAAKARATADRASVKYTWLWILRIRSSLPPTDPGYRNTPGTYYPPAGAPNYNPYSCPLQKGWLDPADPANVDKFGAAVQIAEGVWQTDWTYQVEYDLDIGLPPSPPPPPGSPPAQPQLHTVYVRDQFVFFGIDVGKDEPVRNPGNWSGSDDLPKPYLLDLEKANYRSDGARDAFSFLGVALMNSNANIWPAKFVGGNPSGAVTGVAESFVFNNQSHDLWTQYWQARLQQITDWDYWVSNRMEYQPSDFGKVQSVIGISEDGYRQTHESLQGYPGPMVEAVKTH